MDKQRYRDEVKAYRIVKRNVIKIVNSISFTNMSKATYVALIHSNVTESQIKDMYKEIYLAIGNPQFKRIKRTLKFQLSFEDILLHWLSLNAGDRIVSVQQTLIESIIKVIAQGYEDNLSVAEITYLLQRKFGWFKQQALRIARTETTTATNYATTVSAQQSEYVLEKTWISIQDNRTRRPPRSHFDHLDMNGQKVDENGKFFVGGEELMFPGDPKASAGNTINCRCKIAFTLKEGEDGLPIRKPKTQLNPLMAYA